MRKQAEKLTNERANLRKSIEPNSRCGLCAYFGKPDQCKIVEGPVAEDLLCDWIYGRGVEDVPLYEVSDEDWMAYVRGLIEEQPYQHVVLDSAITPEGPMVLIEDTADPPHRFTLTKEFHVEHTSIEHRWTQEMVDGYIDVGESIGVSKAFHTLLTFLSLSASSIKASVDSSLRSMHTFAHRFWRSDGQAKINRIHGTIVTEMGRRDMAHDTELTESNRATQKAAHRDEDEDEYGSGHEDDDGPTTTIQSILFDKTKTSPEDARKWLKDHGHRSDKMDETDKSLRFRQRDPKEFEEDSLRTVTLSEGVKAVIGFLKGVEKSDGPAVYSGRIQFPSKIDMSKEECDRLSESIAKAIPGAERVRVRALDYSFGVRLETSEVIDEGQDLSVLLTGGGGFSHTMVMERIS